MTSCLFFLSSSTLIYGMYFKDACHYEYNAFIGEKIEDSCWRNEVFNFHLGKFAEVGPFCDLFEADVDNNTKKSLDNFGSNKTIQKVLAWII